MALLHAAHEHEGTKGTFNSFLQARRPLDLMEPKKTTTTLRITVTASCSSNAVQGQAT